MQKEQHGVKKVPVSPTKLKSGLLLPIISAMIRRWRLIKTQRLTFSFNSAFDTRGRSPVDIALILLFAVTVLAIIGTVVYIFVLPQRGETFTEFYILDSQNKAVDYPTNLAPGENGEVTLVIINREQKTLDYTVDVTINGTLDKSIGPVTLEDGQKWESPVSFLPTIRGDNQKAEFALSKSDRSPSPGPLYFWVNVK